MKQNKLIAPVGWVGFRIHRLHLGRKVTPPPTSVLYMTLNHLLAPSAGTIEYTDFISAEYPDMTLFVSASHQTGLDTRSMTRRSIVVGFKGEESRARAKARALLDYTGYRPT